MKRTYFFVMKGIGSLLNLSGKTQLSYNYHYKTPISDKIALASYCAVAKNALTKEFKNVR